MLCSICVMPCCANNKHAVCQNCRTRLPLSEHQIIILADRWYATADFLRACKALGCQVLIRLKRNRKLYRPPVRTSPKGRPPLDGPLFQGSRPNTVYGTEASLMSYDEKG